MIMTESLARPRDSSYINYTVTTITVSARGAGAGSRSAPPGGRRPGPLARGSDDPGGCGREGWCQWVFVALGQRKRCRRPGGSQAERARRRAGAGSDRLRALTEAEARAGPGSIRKNIVLSGSGPTASDHRD